MQGKEKKVESLLRKWKKRKGSKKDHNRRKREYKDLCERRKKERSF